MISLGFIRGSVYKDAVYSYWESPSPGAHHKESIRLYQTIPSHQSVYEWLYNHVFQYEIRYHMDVNYYY